MSQSFGVRLAAGGGQACRVAGSPTLVQGTGWVSSGSRQTRLLQLHASVRAGALRGGLFWVSWAGGREQLERVLPHFTHWGGAVQEARELLWHLPVLPLRRVLAPAAAALPVVLEWTKETEKNK